MSTDAEVFEIELPDAILNVNEDYQKPENKKKISDVISVKSIKSFVIESIKSSPSEKTKHKLNQSGEYKSKEIFIEPEITNEGLGHSVSSIHSQPKLENKDDNQLEEKVAALPEIPKDTNPNYSENEELETTNVDVPDIHKINQEILLQKISSGYTKLFLEEMKMEHWNKYVFEYFYRKRNKRALKDDDIEKVYDLTRKYESFIETASEAVTQERVLKENLEKQENILNFELENLKSEIETNEVLLKKKFFEIGMKTKNSSTRELLSRKYVDRLLMKMSMFRNQMSNMRLDLNKIHAKMMDLLMKTEAIDDLGNGLRLTDFEKLKNATNNLQESVEEEEEELDKFRFHNNIIMLAYIREKLYVNKIKAKIEEAELKELEKEKISLRQGLINLKRKKRSLHKKLRQKKAENALTKNPPLIRDYIKTSDEAEDLRNTVNQYENDINEITNERVEILSELSDIILKRSDSKIFDEKLQEDLRNMDQPVQQPWIKRGIIPVNR